MFSDSFGYDMKLTHVIILLGSFALLITGGCKPSSDGPPVPANVSYDVGPELSLTLSDHEVHIAPDGNLSNSAVDFPQDIPLISDATSTLAVISSEREFVVGQTTKPFAEVEQVYLDQLTTNGWEVDSHRTSASSCVITATNAGRQLTVLLDEVDLETTITYSAASIGE